MHADAERLPQTAVAAISAWRDGGVDLDEIAVLSRVNSTLLPMQVALPEAGIPCSTPLGPDVLRRTGIATTMAYLRIGLAPDAVRREDVNQTIRRPSRGIAPNVTKMLTERPMTSVADIRRLAGRLSGRDVPKLLEYADSLEMVRRACETTTAAAVRAVRVEVGLGDSMDVLDGARREADRSTHADDLLALESLAVLHPDVATFESWLQTALTRRPSGGAAVHLSTIHKIKGREWEHVIVYGASKGLFPHRLSDDEESERRVFHVALTRAVRQVLILADAREPSPFVAELDGSRAREQLPNVARAGRGTTDRFGSNRSPSVIGKVSDRLKPNKRGTRSPSAGATTTAPAAAAAIGLALEHGGHVGTVVELTDAAAVILVGAARLKVPFGTEVRVQGVTMALVAPNGYAGLSDAARKYETALKKWRSEAAKQASVPAYVVLNDGELAGIAARRPTTMVELAQCKGIGPTRLERWGDELLSALDGADV